jgi:DNA-binding response OmpR family regulator
VLLVHDEPLMVQLLHDVLADGFVIETPTDGYEALVKVGADACVTKPLDPDQVCHEIKRLLSVNAVSHFLTGREG